MTMALFHEQCYATKSPAGVSRDKKQVLQTFEVQMPDILTHFQIKFKNITVIIILKYTMNECSYTGQEALPKLVFTF